jgi:hypothetical protein
MSDGKVFVFQQDPQSVSGRLYNFVIGKADLKPHHQSWLISNVSGLLKAGGSISLIGLASPTDSNEVNMALSQRRAEAVVKFLRTIVPNNFKVGFQTALGEHAARYAGVRNGVENDNWRAVVLHAWHLPDPPPPPPPPTPKPITMVKRRVLAHWLHEYKINDRGATSMDGNASRFADASMAIQHESRLAAGGYPVSEHTKQVPATHKVTLIAVSRSTAGSTEYLVSGVDMNHCVVDYNWQKNYWSKGPILLYGYHLIGPLEGHDPSVMRLTEAQAKLWLDDPPKAKVEMRGWRLTGIPYKAYQRGDY